MTERFSEPEPNVIESSAGFSVRVLGLTGMRYTEGDRSVYMDSEVLAKPGPGAIALFKDRMRPWGSPPGSARLSEDESDRIANNVKRAFEACGYELQVQPDRTWD
jgi:hypothetical protein